MPSTHSIAAGLLLTVFASSAPASPWSDSYTLEDTAFILYQSRMVSLNEVGTFIWERFREPAGVCEIVDSVLEQFETTRAQASCDVEEFVRLLAARDLVVARVEAAPS